VKGIPFFRVMASFAGRRRNGELGRSVALAGAPLLSTVAPVTSDVLWIAEEGNAVSSRHKHEHPALRCMTCTLSLNKRGRVLHSVQRPVHANHHSTFWGIPHEGDAFETASRSGKPVKAGGTGTGAGANRA
jgi:hypothetical protein